MSIRKSKTVRELLGIRTNNKYRAKPVRCPVDGYFASQKEYREWLRFKALAQAGAITDLRRQVRFPLIVNGVKVTTYVADFVFTRDGETVIVDAKGYRTKEYQIKLKLMNALGHAITEV